MGIFKCGTTPPPPAKTLPSPLSSVLLSQLSNKFNFLLPTFFGKVVTKKSGYALL